MSKPRYPFFTAQGWLGVELFFILSGYLITSILVKTRGANSYYTSFYTRRVLRILPVFWMTLLPLGFIFPQRIVFLVAIVFFANVSGWLGVSGLYYPLWSLCVEEHFYLIWPFVVRTFRRRILFAVCISICVPDPVPRGFFAWKLGSSFFDVAWYFSGFRTAWSAPFVGVALSDPLRLTAVCALRGALASCFAISMLIALLSSKFI